MSDWRTVELDRLNLLANELEQVAHEELRAAGVSDDRIKLHWMLNLVYPGQTFDTALRPDRSSGSITQTALEATVEVFHRRNEEARLIEARSQEPMLRGVRLSATGLVDHPEFGDFEPGPAPEPLAHRRVYTGGEWHDNVPVYDGEALRPGPEIVRSCRGAE